MEAAAEELGGVNSRAELARAEAVLQQWLREAAMEAGVTMIDPSSVFLSADTRLGQDVEIGPFTVFGPGVTVDEARLFTDPARREVDMVFTFEHMRVDQGASKWDHHPLRLSDDMQC